MSFFVFTKVLNLKVDIMSHTQVNIQVIPKDKMEQTLRLIMTDLQSFKLESNLIFSYHKQVKLRLYILCTYNTLGWADKYNEDD